MKKYEYFTFDNIVVSIIHKTKENFPKKKGQLNIDIHIFDTSRCKEYLLSLRLHHCTICLGLVSVLFTDETAQCKFDC